MKVLPTGDVLGTRLGSETDVSIGEVVGTAETNITVKSVS